MVTAPVCRQVFGNGSGIVYNLSGDITEVCYIILHKYLRLYYLRNNEKLANYVDPIVLLYIFFILSLAFSDTSRHQCIIKNSDTHIRFRNGVTKMWRDSLFFLLFKKIKISKSLPYSQKTEKRGGGSKNGKISVTAYLNGPIKQ